jgi:hypothetical protein
MDAWGWEQLQPWLEMRRELPVGPLFCVINGTTRGRHWSQAAARIAAAYRGGGGSSATLRATPTPARPRRRNGPRRRAARRHPAPTRAQQPRHHQRLSPRHRQPRDHRDRALPTPADDPGRRVAPALNGRLMALLVAHCSTRRPAASSAGGRRLRKRRPLRGSRRGWSKRERCAYAGRRER